MQRLNGSRKVKTKPPKPKSKPVTIEFRDSGIGFRQGARRRRLLSRRTESLGYSRAVSTVRMFFLRANALRVGKMRVTARRRHKERVHVCPRERIPVDSGVDPPFVLGPGVSGHSKVTSSEALRVLYVDGYVYNGKKPDQSHHSRRGRT